MQIVSIFIQDIDMESVIEKYVIEINEREEVKQHEWPTRKLS